MTTERSLTETRDDPEVRLREWIDESTQNSQRDGELARFWLMEALTLAYEAGRFSGRRDTVERIRARVEKLGQLDMDERPMPDMLEVLNTPIRYVLALLDEEAASRGVADPTVSQD